MVPIFYSIRGNYANLNPPAFQSRKKIAAATYRYSLSGTSKRRLRRNLYVYVGAWFSAMKGKWLPTGVPLNGGGFAPPQDWVCFANTIHAGSFDFAQDARAQPGDWLCFSNSLLAILTTRHATRINWLCFFSRLFAVRITQYSVRVNWLCFAK